MRLYSHVSATPLPLDNIPPLQRRQLTGSSTVLEACRSFIYSPHVQSLLEAGSLRAHEPYLQLGKHFGHMTIEEFSSSVFASDWRDEQWKILAAGTLNGIRSKAKTLCAWLLEGRKVSDNGWALIKRAAQSPPRRLTRRLGAEEWSSLLAFLDKVTPYSTGCSGHYGNLLRFMRSTALRYSEALNLNLSDVDFEQGVANLYIPKTKSMREVVLNDDALLILRKYQPWEASGRFFPFGYSSVRLIVYKFNKKRKEEGLSTVFPHLTRHTAITDFAPLADSLRELMDYSGHRSVSGLAPYLHKTASLRETIRDKLNRPA